MDKEDVVHIYNELLLIHKKKKNEIMPFAATWMRLETITLRKRKTNTICDHLHVESKLSNETIYKTYSQNRLKCVPLYG